MSDSETNDAKLTAAWQILGKANEKGKFAVPVGEFMPADVRQAFEEGMEKDLYRLIDVEQLDAARGGLVRVFKLTGAGQGFRKVLVAAGFA